MGDPLCPPPEKPASSAHPRYREAHPTWKAVFQEQFSAKGNYLVEGNLNLLCLSRGQEIVQFPSLWFILRERVHGTAQNQIVKIAFEQ